MRITFEPPTVAEFISFVIGACLLLVATWIAFWCISTLSGVVLTFSVANIIAFNVLVMGFAYLISEAR